MGQNACTIPNESNPELSQAIRPIIKMGQNAFTIPNESNPELSQATPSYHHVWMRQLIQAHDYYQKTVLTQITSLQPDCYRMLHDGCQNRVNACEYNVFEG